MDHTGYQCRTSSRKKPPGGARWQRWIPVTTGNLRIQVLASVLKLFLMSSLLWPTKGLGLLWGQKVLENILLMTLPLRALFRPFQEIRRILWWRWLRGGGWRENLESLKKKQGFPPTSVGKASACNVGDPASIPGSGRSQGGGHGDPLKSSRLENPHGQRSPAGYSPQGRKSRTRLNK